jgi:hypothetical protein
LDVVSVLIQFPFSLREKGLGDEGNMLNRTYPRIFSNSARNEATWAVSS